MKGNSQIHRYYSSRHPRRSRNKRFRISLRWSPLSLCGGTGGSRGLGCHAVVEVSFQQTGMEASRLEQSPVMPALLAGTCRAVLQRSEGTTYGESLPSLSEVWVPPAYQLLQEDRTCGKRPLSSMVPGTNGLHLSPQGCMLYPS